MLGQLLDSPKKPFLAILGGAKVSDKIQVIENLINRVDVVMIGGAMAYTFLKAQGHNIGKSLVESDQLNYARELIKRFEARNKSFLIPIDHRCSTSLTDTQVVTTHLADIEDHLMGIDIGPQTQSLFSHAIKEAGTIFWNGPMGVFETKEFSQGTFRIAHAIAQNTSALRIVGGGDSASAANLAGIEDQIDHISTGGGASLEFLQGDLLPGLEVLRERKR
jgi:phosphoglycerate kinase